MKPTALDAIILKHEGRATQHGSATRAEMMKLAEAARRELQVKTELCEAIVAHNEAEDDPDSGLDGLAEAEARVDKAYADFRQWLAEQEKKSGRR